MHLRFDAEWRDLVRHTRNKCLRVGGVGKGAELDDIPAGLPPDQRPIGFPGAG